MEKEKEIVDLLRELVSFQKENNLLLKQIYSFWSQIVSEEYFNEMINSGKYPK